MNNFLKNNNKGGVVFTFDDGSGTAENWQSAFDMLKTTGFKATFYVYRYQADIENELTKAEKDSIVYLRNSGCEIGSHTLMHIPISINPEDNEQSFSFNEYIEENIIPQHQFLRSLGITSDKNFAWPYGYYGERLGDLMIEKGLFNSCRRAQIGGITERDDENFPENASAIWDGITKHPYGTYTDTASGYSVQHLLNILDYCAANNKIAIFYGHNIDETDLNHSHTTLLSTLILMIKKIKENGMKFYSMNELYIK